MTGDCSQEADIDAFVDGAVAKFGRVDILVSTHNT